MNGSSSFLLVLLTDQGAELPETFSKLGTPMLFLQGSAPVLHIKDVY
jgi:hypothetical protein